MCPRNSAVIVNSTFLLIQLNFLPNDKSLALSKSEASADDNYSEAEMKQLFFCQGEKTLLEKEKVLVTSIFSWSHNVLKGLLLPVCYSLPGDKILGVPKLEAFADDKCNVTQNVKVVFYRRESIVGKEKNAAFCSFPAMFSEGFLL